MFAFSDAYGLRSHSTFCRITGVPPLQSDLYGLSSALTDNTNEPKTRKETRTKPTKMARKKSTLRMTRTTTDKLPTCDYYYKLARRLPAPSPGPALLSAAAGASVYLEPVDSVCSCANPQTYRGCESTAGTVAELKARQKNADHPVFDAKR